MQSDAFPTPPIYFHHFQPRLLPTCFEENLTQDHNEPNGDHQIDCLLNEIELLVTSSPSEASKSFWMATNRIKIKHQVMESMQKIENLFLDLARESTQDPDLLDAVAEGMLYTRSHSSSNSLNQMDIPRFLKNQ